MEPDQSNTNELLKALVAYERSRPPTGREMKKYKDHNGIVPHLRPGPLHSMYPTLTVEEILSTRAIIAHLLTKQYGLSVSDVSGVLRCEMDYVNRLLPVGEELAVGSAVVERMKAVVRRVAQMITTLAEPEEQRAQIKAMVEKPSVKRGRKKIAPPERKALSSADTAQVRCFIIQMLIQEFRFKAANVRPLFDYPTREQIRSMECKSERCLHRWSTRSLDGQRALLAAKMILAQAL